MQPSPSELSPENGKQEGTGFIVHALPQNKHISGADQPDYKRAAPFDPLLAQLKRERKWGAMMDEQTLGRGLAGRSKAASDEMPLPLRERKKQFSPSEPI